MKIQLALLTGTIALATTSSVLACGGNGGYSAPRRVISYRSVQHYGYGQPSHSIQPRIQSPAVPAPSVPVPSVPAPSAPAPVPTPAPQAFPSAPATQPAPSVLAPQASSQTSATATAAASATKAPITTTITRKDGKTIVNTNATSFSQLSTQALLSLTPSFGLR